MYVIVYDTPTTSVANITMGREWSEFMKIQLKKLLNLIFDFTW